MKTTSITPTRTIATFLLSAILALFSVSAFAQQAQKRTIVLVSGAFVTHEGWSEWKSYYESKGYDVIAPAWPYKQASAKELRERQPDQALAQLDLEQLVEYHSKIIDSLPEKPIVIGHSYGGLITQLLVQRDKAAVGVAYHSVPPKGVFSFERSFIKSLWGPLGIFKSRDETFLMSFSQWQYAFTNGMEKAEQQAYYDKLVSPESRNVIWGALGKGAGINFEEYHAPLLFVSGSEDHIIPASLNKKTFAKYQKNLPKGSLIAYKEYEGKNHLAMSQPDWQAEADYILEWAEKATAEKTLPIVQN